MLQEYNDKLKAYLDKLKNINCQGNNGEFNIEEFMNKFIAVQDECQNLKNNLNEIQNNNGMLIKENQEMKEEIEILKQENESLVNEINNIRAEFEKSRQNQYLSFSNNINENEESIQKNSLNSLSMKGQKIFNNNNEFDAYNSNDIFNELKANIHNCLINSNEFIQYCFGKFKENESIEGEFQKNEIWNNLINSLTYLSQLFQACYNLLNNNQNIYNDSNKRKSKNSINHSSLKKTNDKTPQKEFQNDTFKITESNNNDNDNYEINNLNIRKNQELLFEIEKYKEDNKIIYQNYKKLENENIELFFVNKENKFYYKLITRMLQYHINNSDVKNIINKLVLLNGKAISLDIEKNKIKIKIDDISGLISSISSNENSKMDLNSKFFQNNEMVNSEELDKLKKIFSKMEKELSEKYLALKNLDKELKSFEIKEM